MPQTDGRPMPEGFWGRIEPAIAPGRARWLETVASPVMDGAQSGEAGAGVAEMRPRRHAGPPSPEPEPLAGAIHDARNLVAALELYCDLLEEPGVLAESYRHLAGELRRVGAANRRLLEALSPGALSLEALSRLDRPVERPFVSPARAGSAPPPVARLRSRWQSGKSPSGPRPVSVANGRTSPVPGPVSLARRGSRQAFLSGERVENLAAELNANRNLLAAMVGHAVTLGLTIRGGACPVAMGADDLTRVLVNLAKNAAEAMPGGGHLQIALEQGPQFLTLSFTDTGPGIAEHALESIFSPGYSTHVGLDPETETADWPKQHRGLGLSIVRSLVGAAGGAVWAANRIAEPGTAPRTQPGAGNDGATHEAVHDTETGAVFLIEFPLPAEDTGPGS